MEETKKSKIILLICLIVAAVLLEGLLILCLSPRSNDVEDCDFEDPGCMTEEEYNYNTDGSQPANDGTEVQYNSGNEYENQSDEGSTQVAGSGPIDFGVMASRRLTDEDLAGLTKQELRIARNEIYARHGYIFKSQDLKDYFGSKDWYQPMYSDAASLSLNEFERYNVDFIKRYE